MRDTPAASALRAGNYQSQREELAAVFRWSARLGLHESVANHFSLAVSDGSTRFLVNPDGRHFANMRAGDLLLLDSEDTATMQQANAPDATAWAIHSAVHRNAPQARCVLHLHPQYATALSSLANRELPPIDQNTMRFFQRYAIDDDFDGMGLGDEAERLSTKLGKQPVLLLGNHGVLCVGETVALAFNHLYYFERACRNYLTALASGLPLSVVSAEVAEKTARQWDLFIPKLASRHLQEIREILDREEPDYKS